MKTQVVVRFERSPKEGGNEMAVFERAFLPINRIDDYPDLLISLANAGVESMERAKRIRGALADGEETDGLTCEYLCRATVVLEALSEALFRDRTLYERSSSHRPVPTAEHKLAYVLIEARTQQIAAIAEALGLLEKGLAALEGAPV